MEFILGYFQTPHFGAGIPLLLQKIRGVHQNFVSPDVTGKPKMRFVVNA